MTDFEYIKWIIDESHLCREPHHRTMAEDKGDVHRPQVVKLTSVGKDITNVALYQFDIEKDTRFLSFFNRTHDAPKKLRSFCDYIALVEHRDSLYVMLFELKRGDAAGAEDQIAASQEFMHYVLRSAERVKQANGQTDFDIHNVIFRRVIVRRAASNKELTKPKEYPDFDKDGVISCACGPHLNLNRLI